MADVIALIPNEGSQMIHPYFLGLISDIANGITTISSLRLGTIICGYLLLRLYLLKLEASVRPSEDDKTSAHGTPEAKVPNAWRDQRIGKIEGNNEDDAATYWRG